MPDPIAVNSMFGRIAGGYDRANRVLSGGIDLWWRRKLVQAVVRSNPKEVLDLATGSGDVAFALAAKLGPETRITGMDFCIPMLDVARAKQSSLSTHRSVNISFIPGDGLALPCPDKIFDAVTISFGLRNMADRHKSLSEMHRVLRPGGKMFILEFSQPVKWFAPLYYFYLLRVSPWLAGLITGDRAAYSYLGTSIEAFPDCSGLSDEIRRAGFTDVKAKRMTFGIVALHEAVAF